MLRAIVGLAALLFVAVALAMTALNPGAWPVLPPALLIAASCLFEKRYHDRLYDVPVGPRFRPTSERFVDPTTGRTTTVWSDAATGERRYVADDEAPSARQ